MTSSDAEQQELQRVVELLGRDTRPGRLLAYMGAKYFQQQEGPLTEFNIATEVFGRSPKSFDPAQDAVVRVETHRLRKKLRELYEKSADPAGLQISLPPGTYTLRFSLGPAANQSVGDTEDAASNSERPLARTAAYSLLVVSALCVAILVIVAFRRAEPTPSAAAPAQNAHRSSLSADSEPGTDEVHIMAGYAGSEVIDQSGVRWTPDRFFTGGGQWTRDERFVYRTSRPFLFANWRTGEFGYDIPLKQGVYELRLFFVSSNRVGEEKLAGFNASINGAPLLTAFDANISAPGSDVAEEQVFRDITPDRDGYVRLRFSNQVGTAALTALELTPGVAHKLKPIRIITQPNSFIDRKGQRWRADDYYMNGVRSIERRKVSGTDDPELFGGERFGHFSYTIPVDARGRYTLVLHFAEFYFGEQLPGGGGVGSRVFHVFCNGQTLLRDFDIYKEAGSLKVVTKTFPGIQPSAQGKINLTFEPVANNATISAIEVLDESGER
jgi:Malectin domain